MGCCAQSCQIAAMGRGCAALLGTGLGRTGAGDETGTWTGENSSTRKPRELNVHQEPQALLVPHRSGSPCCSLAESRGSSSACNHPNEQLPCCLQQSDAVTCFQAV